MNRLICHAATLAILLAGGFVPAARAQYLDLIGVTALRAVTTNLNGTGIRVAQVEGNNGDNGSTNAWEVNPTNVAQPVALFAFISGLGSSTNYPNAVGDWSSHADAVGNNFYGLSHGVATNVVHVDNLDANYFYDNYVASPSLPNIGDAVINQSYTFGAQTVAVQQQLDSQYDNYAVQNKILFISAACNASINPKVSAPGTAYNCISVGAYSGDSSVGPTIDNGRCKPDITAPAGLTSFSTPLVSGAASVLLQAALRGDGGGHTNAAFDMRTIKALLLNGAVKPADWTNSFSTPLDARYGAGVLNILNAYEQLAGGRQSNFVFTTVSLNAAHLPAGVTNTIGSLNGWDFGTNTSSASLDAIKHYYFNVSNGVSSAKFTATATLVWQRHLNKTNINNLNLFLYNCANSNLVLCSTSLVDNVEHIYTNSLAPGRYDLQVWKAGGTTVTINEGYALAWEFTAPPTLLISGAANPRLTWPVYPAGFLVEARTNLLAGAWSTNSLPAAAITNGLNSISLNPAKVTQFFRLRQPDL